MNVSQNFDLRCWKVLPLIVRGDPYFKNCHAKHVQLINWLLNFLLIPWYASVMAVWSARPLKNENLGGSYGNVLAFFMRSIILHQPTCVQAFIYMLGMRLCKGCLLESTYIQTLQGVTTLTAFLVFYVISLNLVACMLFKDMLLEECYI